MFLWNTEWSVCWWVNVETFIFVSRACTPAERSPYRMFLYTSAGSIVRVSWVSGPTLAWSSCTWPTTMRSATLSRPSLPCSGTWQSRLLIHPWATPFTPPLPCLYQQFNNIKKCILTRIDRLKFLKDKSA